MVLRAGMTQTVPVRRPVPSARACACIPDEIVRPSATACCCAAEPRLEAPTHVSSRPLPLRTSLPDVALTESRCLRISPLRVRRPVKPGRSRVRSPYPARLVAQDCSKSRKSDHGTRSEAHLSRLGSHPSPSSHAGPDPSLNEDGAKRSRADAGTITELATVG
jgi:hypothetical protein